MMNKKLNGLRLGFAGVMVLVAGIGVYTMLTHNDDGLLLVNGVQNLQFFTVDSNLLLVRGCISRTRTGTALPQVGWSVPYLRRRASSS